MTKEDKNLLQEAPKKEEKDNWPFDRRAVFGEAPGNTSEGGLDKQIKLKKRRGSKQYNIVNFWATWCGPCKKEMPHFAAVIKSSPDLHFFFATSGYHGSSAKNEAKQLWRQDCSIQRQKEA